MKFTDLTSNMRSMLTALCASSHLNTEQLGNGCVPKLNGQQAANVLIELRQKGVVYSMQKPDTQRFALWAVTEFGKAVFMGRPDTDVQPAQKQPDVADKVAYVAGKFIVGATGHTSIPCADKPTALRLAQVNATDMPGTDFKVYELIAVANMPVPQAQITLM
jgi:hypothetical protein